MQPGQQADIRAERFQATGQLLGAGAHAASFSEKAQNQRPGCARIRFFSVFRQSTSERKHRTIRAFLLQRPGLLASGWALDPNLECFSNGASVEARTREKDVWGRGRKKNMQARQDLL